MSGIESQPGHLASRMTGRCRMKVFCLAAVLLMIGAASPSAFADDLLPPADAMLPVEYDETPELTSRVQQMSHSSINDWVQGPESGLHIDNGSPGTLFRWSYGDAEGGPDLDAPLVTDRPDFTEASSTVGLGVLQIETGYTFTEDRNGGMTSREHSIGEPLFRYGVFANWLEFRVAVFPLDTEMSGGGMTTRASGVDDLYLGFKIGLTPQDGILPEMTLLPQMTVPSGSNAFTSDEVLAGVNWLYSWEVTEDVSIAGSTQFNRAKDDVGESYIEFSQSASAAFTLTEDFGAYTEWFAHFPTGAEMAPVEHYFNGGFTWLLNNDVQFDIRAGTGLNSAAADFFTGLGVSIRLH